jgi:sulfur-carrier protein
MGGTGEKAISSVAIEVTVPTILRDCTGGRNPVTIEAATLAQALERLRETYPLLRIHLYDETEQLRPHVLIFYNEESTHWLERLDVPLRPGDRLTILQAVSGG